MVIFAVGVLMVIQLNSSLAARMSYAARTSAVVTLTHARLDSLESIPFDSLVASTSTDTLSVDGIAYVRTARVTLMTALLYSIDVSIAPASPGAGPSYSANSFAAVAW